MEKKKEPVLDIFNFLFTNNNKKMEKNLVRKNKIER